MLDIETEKGYKRKIYAVVIVGNANKALSSRDLM